MSWTESYLWAQGCAAAVAIVVAIAGGVLTEVGPWYQSLRKPSWKPPDWAFGPVWTTILVMAAISAALAWEAAPDGTAKAWVFAVLAVNSVLNIAWSGIFFKLRRPDLALIEVGLLWLSILALVVVLGRYSFVAGLLMLPYLVWVSIASFLNYRIVQLNRPFA
jgi:tryptophan-rich sensory protein